MNDVFDLRECVISLLRRWRLFVVLIALCGILLGGVKGLLAYRGFSIQNTGAQVSLADADVQRRVVDLNEELSTLMQQAESAEKYMDHSVLMDINSYETAKATIVFYVDTDYKIMPDLSWQNPDKIRSVLSAYVLMGRDPEIYKRLKRDLALDMNEKDIRELITVWSEDSTINIKVLSTQIEQAESIATRIFQYLSDQQAFITQTVTSHRIELLQKGSSVVNDIEIRDFQQAQRNILLSLNNQIEEKNKELLSLSQERPTELLQMRTVLISTAKWGIFGCVAGAGLAFLLVFFLDSMNVQLRDSNMLRNISLQNLGNIDLENRK